MLNMMRKCGASFQNKGEYLKFIGGRHQLLAATKRFWPCTLPALRSTASR